MSSSQDFLAVITLSPAFKANGIMQRATLLFLGSLLSETTKHPSESSEAS